MPRYDFNGDGRSDILWLYHDNVAVSNWLATPDGNFTINDAHAFVSLAAVHTFDAKAVGDFNGDGRADVLWQVDGGGFHETWLSSADGGFANTFGGNVGFEMGDSNWKIADTGDFNGDGVDDLLWRHNDGRLSNWLGTASGQFVVNDANAMAHVAPNWQILGTGDFNGDGRSDILWRSAEGMVSNWLGTAAGGYIVNDAKALHSAFDEIIAIGDFDGDSRSDLLWQDSRGNVYLSKTLEGGAFALSPRSPVGSVGDGFEVASVGDFNGDAKDDILWRYSDGSLHQWFGDGTLMDWLGEMFVNHFNGGSFNQHVPNEWQVADYLL
jgi:FG-GAP-like repeat